MGKGSKGYNTDFSHRYSIGCLEPLVLEAHWFMQNIISLSEQYMTKPSYKYTLATHSYYLKLMFTDGMLSQDFRHIGHSMLLAGNRLDVFMLTRQT